MTLRESTTTTSTSANVTSTTDRRVVSIRSQALAAQQHAVARLRTGAALSSGTHCSGWADPCENSSATFTLAHLLSCGMAGAASPAAKLQSPAGSKEREREGERGGGGEKEREGSVKVWPTPRSDFAAWSGAIGWTQTSTLGLRCNFFLRKRHVFRARLEQNIEDPGYTVTLSKELHCKIIVFFLTLLVTIHYPSSSTVAVKVMYVDTAAVTHCFEMCWEAVRSQRSQKRWGCTEETSFVAQSGPFNNIT